MSTSRERPNMRYVTYCPTVKGFFVRHCWSTVLGLVLTAQAASAQVLKLDFDELDSVGGATLTEPGFQSFTIDTGNAIVTTPVTRVYGAITATLSPSAAFGFDDRQRATPTNNGGGFTTENLLRDFVFSRATGSGNTDGFDLTLSGLAANTPHTFTIWSSIPAVLVTGFQTGSPTGSRSSRTTRLAEPICPSTTPNIDSLSPLRPISPGKSSSAGGGMTPVSTVEIFPPLAFSSMRCRWMSCPNRPPPGFCSLGWAFASGAGVVS